MFANPFQRDLKLLVAVDLGGSALPGGPEDLMDSDNMPRIRVCGTEPARAISIRMISSGSPSQCFRAQRPR
jgi:hypothetical protein